MVWVRVRKRIFWVGTGTGTGTGTGYFEKVNFGKSTGTELFLQTWYGYGYGLKQDLEVRVRNAYPYTPSGMPAPHLDLFTHTLECHTIIYVQITLFFTFGM